MDDDFAKAHLHDKLRAVREALVWKLEGLSEQDIRRPMTPTGTNLLGLVKHNALSDARYFGEVFDRTPPVDLPPWDTAGWWAATHRATEHESRSDVLDLYRDVSEYVDATIEELPIDAPGYVPWWDEKVMLFNIMAARLCDATRHAGHADILRETIDGSVGVDRETAPPRDVARSASAHTQPRASRVHGWAIPEREYARQETRRGRRYAYETLEPARTALVVVDLVPFFYESNPTCYAITPNVGRLADALRAAGGVVAWVVPGDPGPTKWAREFLGEEAAEMFRRSGGAGPIAGRLGPGLEAREGDLLVEKTAISALFPGSSTLHDQLRSRGVETVVVTGTLTEVCVAGTARDAATLGYRTILVADATAGRDDESHDATLSTIYRTFGDVRSTDDVIELVTAGSSVVT
ncbi:isochorismatase family protein [Nocardioides panzhihuensis]|uniref:Nicotinamidase-related amidase n=1 Tax=Nocardioides panzhihuensis TaxID=860243 RepID=A0A7Z0DJG7_9ACTN|nr:nicotinamidase-related amidase [Nocardioides panzhihuensis]